MLPLLAASLTAIKTRLALVVAPVEEFSVTSMMTKNQRFERRSNLTCGSDVKDTSPAPGGVTTEAKNTSESALITPSATPVVLLNVRSLPFRKTTNWVGPTVPIVSGGNAPVSVGPVAP